MSKVLVTMTAPGMRYLPHRRTDRGTYVPVITAQALRTALDNDSVVRRALFQIVAAYPGVKPVVRSRMTFTLDRLVMLGVTEVHLRTPDGGRWATLSLSRCPMVNDDAWTLNEWAEAQWHYGNGDFGWLPKRTLVTINAEALVNREVTS